MFKVGLELPSEVAKDPALEQKKQKKKKGTDAPLTGNDLQKMMEELKEENPKKKKRAGRDEKLSKKQRIDKEQAAEPAKEKPAKENSAKEKPEMKKAENGDINKRTDSAQPRSTKEPVKDSTKESVKPTKARARQEPPVTSGLVTTKKLTPLQLKMQQKLSGARFRWINEQLYTTDSQHAFNIFQKQPEVFKEYHDGFRHQVEQWPENPVNSFVQQFKDRTLKPVNAPGGLPGDKPPGTSGKVVVADMGCGEAELALQLNQFNKAGGKKARKPQFEVHSFDMHKGNDRITVADIANVPLENSSCHVVVFCLALMGINLADFINEAIRILKPNGLVWIAEIKSRFENNDFTAFVDTLKDMGLYHRTTDDSNKMFVKFEFVKLPHKLERAKNKNPEITLKPCIYKRR